MSAEITVEKTNEKKICGVVMPISAIDGCSEGHWAEVLAILNEAISEAGFTPNLVSYADDVGIIQKRIIQNLYDNPIVVCDVSGKNPNVMFELGIRLAFDKPTIIIKDDKTTYSFDTAPIEHLEYPRDLRFSKILDFKKNLIEKIAGTYQKSQADRNYTTFLKHFGTFTVAKLDTKVVSSEAYVMEELKSLRKLVEASLGRPYPVFENVITKTEGKSSEGKPFQPEICIFDLDKEKADKLCKELLNNTAVSSVTLNQISDGHFHVRMAPRAKFDRDDVLNVAKTYSNKVHWINSGNGHRGRDSLKEEL